MEPEVISNQSPGALHAHAIGAPVQQVKIDLGPSTIAIVASMLVIIAACGVVLGLNLAKQDQMDREFKDLRTQEWLTERRLMDREALDLVNGKKLSSDDEYGPTGNLKRMVPKK